MSDSDCSNCEKDDCPYYGWTYYCYVRLCKEMQTVLTPENVEKFKQIHELAKDLNDKHNIDEFYQIERASFDVINMYETQLEKGD